MHSSSIAVVEVANLKGLFSCQAMDDIPSGSFLSDLWGPVSHSPNSHSMQIDINKHVQPQGPLVRFNHSCKPNAKFIYKCRIHVEHSDCDIDEKVFWYCIAVHDMKKGEDITFDYTTTEYDMAEPFQCKCKESNCLGEIKGFKYLTPEQQNERMNDISPAVVESWNRKL